MLNTTLLNIFGHRGTRFRSSLVKLQGSRVWTSKLGKWVNHKVRLIKSKFSWADLGFRDCYRNLDGFGDLLWFGIQLPDLLFNHGHNPSRWWFVNGFNGGSLCVEWSPIKMAFFYKGYIFNRWIIESTPSIVFFIDIFQAILTTWKETWMSSNMEDSTWTKGDIMGIPRLFSEGFDQQSLLGRVKESGI